MRKTAAKAFASVPAARAVPRKDLSKRAQKKQRPQHPCRRCPPRQGWVAYDQLP
jgi:hypothetical protein